MPEIVHAAESARVALSFSRAIGTNAKQVANAGEFDAGGSALSMPVADTWLIAA